MAAGTGAGLGGGAVCVVVACVEIGALDVDSGVPDALAVVATVDVDDVEGEALGAADPVGPLSQALRHMTAPITATAETSTLTEGFLPIPRRQVASWESLGPASAVTLHIPGTPSAAHAETAA
ncbi:hypothetical protein KO481_36275 [Nocardia sp. NEAU-G5]|uniref:Secreted protein n=1 Tax=Nocardia albiluteola TaxID=2842303 RepID=A0ABS6B9I2_9NOCA|nr:hypothetical protein [Nocardia albiluteola]MBU3066966.1 hypothetical protein [Nocardia albiluteola]